MHDFLEKIHLILHKQIRLPIDKSEFIKKFKQNVDEGSVGAFSGIFEAFSASKNRYKGNITQNTFEMRKKRTFFDRTGYLVRISGSLKQQNDQLIIDAEIKGFNNFLILFYIIVTLFYIFFTFMFISSFTETHFPIIFVFIHAVLVYSIPYFFTRKGIQNTAIDFERELFFIIREEL